jgi:hypothetical protein
MKYSTFLTAKPFTAPYAGVYRTKAAHSTKIPSRVARFRCYHSYKIGVQGVICDILSSLYID